MKWLLFAVKEKHGGSVCERLHLNAYDLSSQNSDQSFTVSVFLILFLASFYTLNI